jgi:hypothetical protein
VSKIFKESIKKIKMKKLFALLMVAGTLSLYSCGGEKKVEETAGDSTAVEATAETTVMDTAAAAPMDSAATAPMDSAAAAPAAH